ncbi:MAG: endolytic transglycosylase MltG [Rhodospirillaceae bacterium]|nr:endolytic transglycosylase MltG [Rhodospirillaceae bacterium]
MRRTAGVFSFLLTVTVVAGLGVLALIRASEAPGPADREITVVVPRGAGVESIASLLTAEGVIDEPRLFVVTAVLRGDSGSLQAGEYAFPPRASVVDVLARLNDGAVLTYQVTVPEGWTSAQVVAALNANEHLTGAVAAVPPEGSLLPETYRFRRGDTRAELLDRMARAHDALLAELWEARAADLPFDTPQEAVTLASIVEAETPLAEERPVVAGVFVNRLETGMRLDSDPTVAYAITQGRQPLGRPLTRADINATQSPYNTYRSNGLPPGPINNPGRAALEAALNPAETPYLFFVADGSGGHVFAETLAEHNRNVRAAQAARDAAEQPADPPPDQ